MKLKTRWIDMAKNSEPRSPYTIIHHSQRETITNSINNRIYSGHLTNSCLQSRSDNPRQFVSLDPRLWNKQDVHSWLAAITLHHNIDIDISRFNMNGKALCLMSVEMFVKRVPVGGKLLYRDFRTRLHTAVYLEDTMVRTLRRIQSIHKHIRQ